MGGPGLPLDEALRADARRFEVQLCLGSGGFGEVYLATMVSPAGVRTEVAVKVLHEGLDPRSQAVQRLRDEGRLLGTLNHPCVLKVHDLVMLGERVALVMEYVPGLDLEGSFESAPPLSLRAGMEVLARVSDALHTAWNAPGPDGSPLRLVHRDIKPSNIRIGQHGEVKLLDFGIAKAADARREAKTQTRVTIGSPWYMAPERFDGVSDHPGSDVYALGCTLYELCAGGTRLFDALSARQHFLLAMDAGAHDAHVREHLARASAPEDVRGLLASMLAFHVEARPTAGELGPRFDDLAESVPGLALRRWCRDLTWPAPKGAQGALVGQVLTEHRISGLTTPETPSPASRREATAALAGSTFVVPGAPVVPPTPAPPSPAPPTMALPHSTALEESPPPPPPPPPPGVAADAPPPAPVARGTDAPAVARPRAGSPALGLSVVMAIGIAGVVVVVGGGVLFAMWFALVVLAAIVDGGAGMDTGAW